MRRAVDLVIATGLLVVTSPLLLLGAIAVLVGSGTPILFRQDRLGLHGRRFRCLKLRTMVVDAEERLARDPTLYARYRANGYKLSLESDPRVTVVGAWLRRTYLDELPQLFNVLRGHMALIGPRPIVPAELAEYDGSARRLLALKPGLFGPWVARGATRPPYPERIRVELEYFTNRTLFSDIALLLRCLPVVFRGEPQPTSRVSFTRTEEDAA